VNKLREGAYEARRKREEAATLALKRMWAKTWVRMSTQFQSKVREYPDFERASLDLDSIALWNFIRKSHLTHIYGEDDEMSAVNIPISGSDSTTRLRVTRVLGCLRLVRNYVLWTS
jgi:hypothetical protein